MKSQSNACKSPVSGSDARPCNGFVSTLVVEEVRRLDPRLAANLDADGQLTSEKLISALLEEVKRLRTENKKLAKKAKKAGQKNATMCAQLARSTTDLHLQRKEVARLNNAALMSSSTQQTQSVHPAPIQPPPNIISTTTTTTTTSDIHESVSQKAAPVDRTDITETNASSQPADSSVASNCTASAAASSSGASLIGSVVQSSLPPELAQALDNIRQKIKDLEVEHARKQSKANNAKKAD